MKVFIIVLLLFVLQSGNSALCQNNTQFIDSTKKWNTLGFGLASFLNPIGTHTTITHFIGDTLINGLKYSKVWESEDSLLQNWESRGFIREDTTNHKVFYLNTLSEEGLIYDFGILPYDTVTINNTYLHFPYPVSITCYLIDTILINNEYRSRYYLGVSDLNNQYINRDTWIEGIGSIDGIFSSAIHEAGYAGGYLKLLCYSENDSVLYMNSTFHTCYTNTLTPQILTTTLDTALINTYYEFHLQISDTTIYDTISWMAWTIPTGFQLDEINGIVYGNPITVGNFPCIIAVRNNGIITDVLQSHIPVILPTGVNIPECKPRINISPNPTKGIMILQVDPNHLGYKYLICTQNGEIVEERIIFDSLIQFDYNNLPRGTYLIKIINFDNNTVFAKKLILN
jgi:hypothetical protein